MVPLQPPDSPMTCRAGQDGHPASSCLPLTFVYTKLTLNIQRQLYIVTRNSETILLPKTT